MTALRRLGLGLAAGLVAGALAGLVLVVVNDRRIEAGHAALHALDTQEETR